MQDSVTFERIGAALVKVRQGSRFAGFLVRSERTHAAGLNRMRVATWDGIIGGANVRALTLTLAKARARAALASVNGSENDGGL